MAGAKIDFYPAAHWLKRPKGGVECRLCPFNCVLSEGKTGICKGKKNIGGSLKAINYGLTTSMNMDPIEKKPLYHFFPGSRILSIGPNGCNLKCDFCQNYGISQEEYPTRFFSPEEIVNYALSKGSIGIAYTYTEPLIWFEYVLDCSKAARAKGLVNVLVTNGVINRDPLDELIPWIDAMNIDIKSMDDRFYKKICKGPLNVVLDSVRRAVGSVHVEITNLVISGLNDSDDLFFRLTDFLADLDPLIALHFSRYHPDYQQTAPRTPVKTLERAVSIASKKLKHVFIGNIASDSANQTLCPECRNVIIKRRGYIVEKVTIDKGKCRLCGADTGVTGA